VRWKGRRETRKKNIWDEEKFDKLWKNLQMVIVFIKSASTHRV